MTLAEWGALGLFFVMGFAVMAFGAGAIRLYELHDRRRQRRKISAHNQRVMRKPKVCRHANVVDVDLIATGEIVAHLCIDCGVKLELGWNQGIDTSWLEMEWIRG